ncbi:MAG: MaoC family dehydratase N-terminal domain-containing protein [Gemmataceae bacterium]|nr:MaoC family dehydratase N-terminal domain-containing protein [Gemmataceae bacterium]
MSFTDHHLFFDDVAVGQEWMSLGRTLTEADIVGFAGLSGDFNPIHMDHEFARTTPYRRPIAHGLLIWSIASGLGQHAPPMRTLAFTKVCEWHFREPVFIGDTIRCKASVVGKTERARGRRGLIIWKRTVFNQADHVVQDGTIETLVEGRAALNRHASDDEQLKAIAG